NNQHARAYAANELEPEKRKLPKNEEDARKVTNWMCANFFDIRAFGAVMSTDVNCGQVRGPIQFGIARSIDPIVSQEYAVTRCAVTTEKEAKDQSGDNRTMGRKFAVPYGLYRAHGFINPHLAKQTGFDSNGADLHLLWTALARMFEADRAAARGEMAAQRLIVFKHESPLGNAPANKLFALVGVQLADPIKPPRSFNDYLVEVNDSELPEGIMIVKELDLV
ncbi:MAG: type I-C CRISPR-associated protein Cas7/Csd2, partial [Planctomycetaceae bacterium]|nr:type I-C CRISPR-associated protein Cas7/Csd2 [Planctomycetaceae bacterium]